MSQKQFENGRAGLDLDANKLHEFHPLYRFRIFSRACVVNGKWIDVSSQVEPTLL